MSQPEISRRCLECGASVRAGARFCQQCGNNLSEQAGAGGRVEAQPAGEGASSKDEVVRAFEIWRSDEGAVESEAVRAAEAAPAGDSSRPFPAEPETPGERAASAAEFSARPAAQAGEAGEAGAAAGAKLAGAVEATRRRAASVVKESIVPRVERVRDRSVVMLEEAPDDNGLRFIIIAAVLFGLSVFLLVLSTVIK